MRQFIYQNKKWAAELTGISNSVNSQTMTSFGVKFTCISDNTIGPHYGSMSHNKLTDVSDEELVILFMQNK